jgi:hypothetical protein
MIWCNTHRRPAYLCKVRGGIMLPCKSIDLTDILEVEYIEDETLDEYKAGKGLQKVQPSPSGG